MKFKAEIKSRSSLGNFGPPSETEILRRNPKRREMILNKTGWDDLYEGTLNLKVHDNVVTQIRKRKPLIQESGSSVLYPEHFQRIPKERKNYFYFRGTISKDGCSEAVLFRTAEVPPHGGLIEAFAPVRLRENLSIADGDQVDCDIPNSHCRTAGSSGSQTVLASHDGIDTRND